jgi:hypothetical protein
MIDRGYINMFGKIRAKVIARQNERIENKKKLMLEQLPSCATDAQRFDFLLNLITEQSVRIEDLSSELFLSSH